MPEYEYVYPLTKGAKKLRKAFTLTSQREVARVTGTHQSGLWLMSRCKSMPTEKTKRKLAKLPASLGGPILPEDWDS